MNDKSCPYCGAKDLVRSWAAPGQAKPLPEPPPHAVTICSTCAGVCKIKPDGHRRKITDEELAAISPEGRKVLDNAVNMIQARMGKRN